MLVWGLTWGEVRPDGVEKVFPREVCSGEVVFTKNWDAEKQNETRIILRQKYTFLTKISHNVVWSIRTASGRPCRRRCVSRWSRSESCWGTPGSWEGVGRTRRWPLTCWSCWERRARRKAAWAAAPPPGETPVVNIHRIVFTSSVCLRLFVCVFREWLYIQSPGTQVSGCSCCRSHRARHRCRRRRGDEGNPRDVTEAWSSPAKGTANIQ